MGIQYSLDVRNAKLDSIEKSAGTSPILAIWSGNKPDRCSSSESGTLLARIELPRDWMASAINGVKSKLGEWSATALASGIPGYFRIYSKIGKCHVQGAIGVEMLLDSYSIAEGQVFTVTTFNIRDNND